jgi:hypothetical protein
MVTSEINMAAAAEDGELIFKLLSKYNTTTAAAAVPCDLIDTLTSRINMAAAADDGVSHSQGNRQYTSSSSRGQRFHIQPNTIVEQYDSGSSSAL